MIKLPRIFNPKQALWSALDGGVPGELMVVQVQSSRQAGSKPKVIAASHVTHAGWDAAVVRSLLDARSKRTGLTVGVLPRGDYQLMLLPRPPVAPIELERSVRWAIGPQIDYPVEDAVLVTLELPDIQPNGMPKVAEPRPDDDGRNLYVVATQAQVVNHVAQVFQDAGQRLDAIDIRETPQRNIAALLEEPDECLCLLRVVRDGIQLTFTHRGELYLDRFVGQPMSVLQGDDEFERQRLIERVSQQTLISINHIQTQHVGLTVKRVVICPFLVPLNLDDLVKQIGLPAQTLDLASIFDLSAVPALLAPREQARYFIALGATLRSLGAKT